MYDSELKSVDFADVVTDVGADTAFNGDAVVDADNNNNSDVDADTTLDGDTNVDADNDVDADIGTNVDAEATLLR